MCFTLTSPGLGVGLDTKVGVTQTVKHTCSFRVHVKVAGIWEPEHTVTNHGARRRVCKASAKQVVDVAFCGRIRPGTAGHEEARVWRGKVERIWRESGQGRNHWGSSQEVTAIYVSISGSCSVYFTMLSYAWRRVEWIQQWWLASMIAVWCANQIASCKWHHVLQ